jgi:hypothetical protein
MTRYPSHAGFLRERIDGTTGDLTAHLTNLVNHGLTPR